MINCTELKGGQQNALEYSSNQAFYMGIGFRTEVTSLFMG